MVGRQPARAFVRSSAAYHGACGAGPGSIDIHRDIARVSGNDPWARESRSAASHCLSPRPDTQVVRLVHRTIPPLKRMEKLIHPRWRTPFETTKRIVGFVVLLLGATLVSLFPFSHIIPALVIMLISF